MTKAYWTLAFTPNVQALQRQDGSDAHYRLDPAAAPDRLSPRETDFINRIDGFYLGSVSQTGWPYVQFRGGPPGFLHVIDDATLAFADMRGNRQMLTAGNLRGDDRVSLFLMDYRHQRRLKMMGHMRFAAPGECPDMERQALSAATGGVYQRLAVIRVAAFDWNCPQHIPLRLTGAELEDALTPARDEISRLTEENAALRRQLAEAGKG